MPSERVEELKRHLDELTLRWEPLEDDLSEDARAMFEGTLRIFRSAGPEIIDDATEYVRAYYHSERENFTVEERVEYGIPEIGDDEDILGLRADHGPTDGRSWRRSTRTRRFLPLVRGRSPMGA